MMDPVLPEILTALEMPPEGLAKWFHHLEDFCREHGGDRHYSDLLKLLAECDAAVKKAGNESR